MVGNQNTDVAIFQLPHNVLDILHGNRVNASKGLVEHDEFRFNGQTARNLRSTTLTTRQLVTFVLAHLFQAELLDQRLQLLCLILSGVARHLKHCHDIIFHAQLAEHAGLLRQIAYTCPGALINRVISDFLLVDEYMTCIGNNQTGGHVKRSGLTSTVRT